MLKIWGKNWTEEIGLVTPTPGTNPVPFPLLPMASTPNPPFTQQANTLPSGLLDDGIGVHAEKRQVLPAHVFMFIFQFCSSAQGGAVVEYRIVSFNSNGRDDDGDCCDSILGICDGCCDPVFRFCLDMETRWINLLLHWGQDKMAAICRRYSKCIISIENHCILINISLEFVPGVRINNKWKLDKLMTWHRTPI